MLKKILFLSIGALAGCALWSGMNHSTLDAPADRERQISSQNDLFNERVQPVLSARCVACHSCLESPCQINLQSYQGLVRGGHTEEVYGETRRNATAPTRMFEDAETTADWRKKGFHDILGSGRDSVLMQALAMGRPGQEFVKIKADDKRVCMNHGKADAVSAMAQVPRLAMPYGLTPIRNDEYRAIQDWYNAGAPAPAKEDRLQFSDAIRDKVKAWNQFFNQPGLKAKLTARYLYEHLFLAHMYFPAAPREFLQIIRSNQSCDQPEAIATRLPNDDPGVENVYYCLVKARGTIVSKNHIPYELNNEKLAWLQKSFIDSEWTVKALPSYEAKVAANPFETFQAMPIRARYEFLLMDSHYHIMTFIKGPVCVRSAAVDSIQEQFYVFFTQPESDLMVRSSDYARSISKRLLLPGSYGDSIRALKTPKIYLTLLKNRDRYREMENAALEKMQPNGFGLKDIWDGGGTNKNAVLTVFRHDDNASVMQGARGDLSKTAFVLNYSTFERLVYNLVVNFDVFGNYKHQVLTRLYMDMLRMDSENAYLTFLPPDLRNDVKKSWYKGVLTALKRKVLDEDEFARIPSQIKIADKENAHRELVQKILFERLSPAVRGPDDALNWKSFAQKDPADSLDRKIKGLTAVRGDQVPFAQFFPEVSYLIVGTKRVYSLIRHREHSNISWIYFESARLAPEEDSLTIQDGIVAFYANQIFYVKPGAVEQMVQDMKAIRSEGEYENFLKTYGVARRDPQFWHHYDFITRYFQSTNPIEAGVIDLSRYRF